VTSRAVVFDCDGVLFDSWHANVAYYNAIRERLGLPPMEPGWQERAHYLAGSQVIEEMFKHDRALFAEARRFARVIDYDPFYALMEPMPGLYDVLALLRRTWRLGMATNRGATVPGVVERFGLGAYLDAAVGVLDVARAKPHPDVVLEVGPLGVAPAAAVYRRRRRERPPRRACRPRAVRRSGRRDDEPARGARSAGAARGAGRPCAVS
jgi:phosphoglycolate phosphatase-like HAD superfamily hydrolase